jgi:hypothetical protein
MKSLVPQMAAEDKAARPGFVSEAQFDVFFRQLFDEFIDGIECAADDAVTTDLGGVLRCDGDGDGFFVDVQADIMDDFIASSGMFWVFFIGQDKGPTHPSGKRCRP